MAVKAKRESGRKTKKAPNKQKKVPVLVASMIGVISTINIKHEMKHAIKAGVNDPGIKLKFVYVGSYKRAKLKKKIEKLNNDTEVGLIITLGGNKTFDAATALSDKNFVSLVGSIPTPQPAKCKGGVSLNSFMANGDRIDHLVNDKKKKKNKIALLCNPNSSMNVNEENNWTNALSMPASSIYHAGKDNQADENDSSTFQAAFETITDDNMQAVIISADPFFQDAMDELVADANKSGVYVTYPLQDYANAWEPPESGQSTLQGPDLIAACTSLGGIAAAAFRTGTDQGFSLATSATFDR
jgi:hypothetical protein